MWMIYTNNNFLNIFLVKMKNKQFNHKLLQINKAILKHNKINRLNKIMLKKNNKKS